MIQSIPLNKLVPSPRNVRKYTDPKADAELKASIAAQGLLQNLVVRPAKKGLFEVEAGGRRRTALLALADEKVVARNMPITCLVVGGDETAIREVSLAENFHRLAMNPADEAQAFASIIESGASVDDVARRFGQTVRFVEGRLRLASLAPVVFEALTAGDITLDIAKAYGATSDQAVQERVFKDAAKSWYASSPDSIRRMVLNSTVQGSDPRARLVGKDAYLAAGGRIDRELFDDEDSESWSDIALLEQLATVKMSEIAACLASEAGVAWVKPTLENYVTHDVTEGLQRVPTSELPLSEAEIERLSELDTAYDTAAEILEDEDADEEAVRAAETKISEIDAETTAIRNRPQIIDSDIKASTGLILTLGRDGAPVLQPQYYADTDVVLGDDDSAITVVTSDASPKSNRATMSQRLVDELAMQRRDVLALHVASDPGLALDLFVFALAEADTARFGPTPGLTIRGAAASGPAHGFVAHDAAATASLAELRSGLDESWRAGDTVTVRFDLFRSLDEAARAAWLGWVVGRTLEASLNMQGGRSNMFHDHLGRLLGIDMAAWWRPTAANFFDRVSKTVILDALADVGGATLSSRFTASKKGDLAASAERIFSGNFITEVEVKDRALGWLPAAMTFATAPSERSDEISERCGDEVDADTQNSINSPEEGDDSHVSAELAA